MRFDLRAIACAFVLLSCFPATAAPLIGPGVGNADALQSEGNRLYNRKQYGEAARVFLQATRAAPEHLPTYLSLARSNLKSKRIAEACYAYRTFVRASPEGEERSKAQSELELCERQLRTGRQQAEESARNHVEKKAAFFAALEGRNLVGSGSAGETLRELVVAGYLGPDLGEMANKLCSAASLSAESLHQRALARERLDAGALRSGAALYDLAATFGPAPEGHLARRAFLDGLVRLHEAVAPAQPAAQEGPGTGDIAFASVRAVPDVAGAHAAAIERFSAAMEAAPSVMEYRFFHALAIWRSGDRQAALAALQRDLPDDPRTAVLGALLAADGAAGSAAAAERVLFGTRYPAGR